MPQEFLWGYLTQKKKVIVFIGDGGATIGLQHLLEAARMNIPMCVIVHNNMLYGMTGGQASGLTPKGFKTTVTPHGNYLHGHDLCELVRNAGAPYVSRILAKGDISDKLAEAISVSGFSLVEVMEICISAAKMNVGMKLENIVQASGCEIGVWKNEPKNTYKIETQSFPTLFEDIPIVDVSGFDKDKTKIETKRSIIIGGSAGEGVQRAASLLTLAAVYSGLHATQKGSFPVTVGTGFSTSEIIIASEWFNYHGITEPDFVIITSRDGLEYNKKIIRDMKSGVLFIDSSLEPPDTSAKIIRHDFRCLGPRNAAIYSIFYFLKSTGILPPKTLSDVIRKSDLATKIPVEKIEKLIGICDL